MANHVRRYTQCFGNRGRTCAYLSGPRRGACVSLWLDLIDTARENIDILVFAGSFLHDGNPDFRDRIVKSSRKGVSVRILLGDPTSDAVATRGHEEGIGDLMAARCRLSIAYLRGIEADGVQVRLHSTTLYASVFRFDRAALVNIHALGVAANSSPLMHIQRIDGCRLFDHYAH